MVQLTAQPRTGYKFVSWGGDLSGTENPQSLLMDSHKYIRAFFIDEQSFESARLTSGNQFNLLFGTGSDSPEDFNGYWINVPPGATQLDIRLVTTTPAPKSTCTQTVTPLRAPDRTHPRGRVATRRSALRQRQVHPSKRGLTS